MPNYYDASIGAAFEAIAAKMFREPSWSSDVDSIDALFRSIRLAVVGLGAPEHVAKAWISKDIVISSAMTIAAHLEEDGASRPHQFAYTVTGMTRLFTQQLDLMRRRRSNKAKPSSPDHS